MRKIFKTDKNNFSWQKGFTLIEFMAAAAVLGVISALVLTAINPGKRIQRTRDTQRKSELRDFASALETYFVEHGEYPYPSNRLDPYRSTSGLDRWIPELTFEYSKTQPKDPVNSGWTGMLDADDDANRSYIYISESAIGGVAGEYYFLLARLENDDDPETLDNLPQRPKWPDCTTGIGFDGSFYIIRSYNCTGE